MTSGEIRSGANLCGCSTGAGGGGGGGGGTGSRVCASLWGL